MTEARILIAALLVGFTLASCLAAAREAPKQQFDSLTSKILPAPHQPKVRAARSLSDVFEKMKSKLFGGRKSQQQQQVAQASSAISSQSPAAGGASSSLTSAQRGQQSWTDLNSFNQQFNPYSPLGNSYQWPLTSSASNQFLSQPFAYSAGGLGSFGGQQSGIDALQQSASNMAPGASTASAINGQQQSQQQQQSAGASTAPNGGILSSASQLIAQYLSPSLSGAQSGAQSNLAVAPGAAPSTSSVGQQQSISGVNSLLTPQQQQQQAQYNEFASILDSMVAQTGAANPSQQQQQQRQPGQQYSGMNSNGMQPQQQAAISGYQSNQGAGAMMPVGQDNEMSGSNNVQSYMPQASSQQASQKSSMVSLAEQLAPGANFNKLVSFPFSLTNNEDSSKEGRYKLHIPFLNQHVKRSDQQKEAASVAAQQQQQQRVQQQMQQYINNYYNQQQLYSAASQQQQQMIGQPSQVVASIASPQSSANSAAAPSASSSQQVSPSSSVGVSSASSTSSGAAPSALVSQMSSASAHRPSWSVAELQPASNSASVSSSSNGSPSSSAASSSSSSSSVSSSSSSSSKLIPMQSSSGSSSIDQ